MMRARAGITILVVASMVLTAGFDGSLPSPLGLSSVARAQEASRAGSRRARPRRAPRPRFEQRIVDVFFADALNAVGPGEPPVVASSAATIPTPSTGGFKPSNPTVPSMPATGGGEAPGEGWASLISAESLEDEIKRQVPLLSESVRTVGSFRGGAYRDAARQLSHLAVLFGVVAEHEGDVRWQDQAAGLRDLFAKAGFNCKAGSEATYNEAKQRNQDLADSIRGATFDVPDADVPAVWPEVADRRLLMLRMEEAVRERLDRWTASNDEFAANSDEVAHEAQIVGTLSRVIQHPEYEFGDDETFVDYAKDLEKYCRELVEASRQDQFEKAQSAATNVSKSCDACHADYRG